MQLQRACKKLQGTTTLWDLLRLRGIPATIIGLLTGLYSRTVSALNCGGGVSSFFPVNTGVRQGCVLAPSLFNTYMDWVLGRVVEQSHCRASVAESLEVLVMALEALHEEVKPLGLKVSWAKTKVQVFGGVLDETVQYVHACGEDIEILKNFTYLGSVVHNDGGSKKKSHGGLASWPTTTLWIRSTRVFGVVDTCADGQRFGSSSRW